MKTKMIFKYFCGEEANQFSFYRIPKELFTNEYFKNLSSDAKILYGLMLDRMSLSVKNQWFDDKKRAYIYFSIEEIMENLNCGRNKAIKSLQELDNENGIGLIEKRRQGFGKTNIIYVKSFMPDTCEEKIDKKSKVQKFINQTTDRKNIAEEVPKTNSDKFKKQTSESPENKLQEVCKTNPNYTNFNYTETSKNESNHILSDQKRFDSDEMDELHKYQAIIKQNIGYESLLHARPSDRAIIQGIYELIVEVLLCQNNKILIASNWYPSELVKSKFMKLNDAHIEYVLECFKKNTTKVNNIKKYILAALFNAPATIDGYYKAEVNHDMPQFAV